MHRQATNMEHAMEKPSVASLLKRSSIHGRYLQILRLKPIFRNAALTTATASTKIYSERGRLQHISASAADAGRPGETINISASGPTDYETINISGSGPACCRERM